MSNVGTVQQQTQSDAQSMEERPQGAGFGKKVLRVFGAVAKNVPGVGPVVGAVGDVVGALSNDGTEGLDPDYQDKLDGMKSTQMELLEAQMAFHHLQATTTAASNMVKTRHDSAMAAISNLK